ncbi:MAG TPA: ABC transporter substrate-binding protein [Firmicutes bacterium]|nr:ABC transporter substrate-binding protein [Bacillota bacterium]
MKVKRCIGYGILGLASVILVLGIGIVSSAKGSYHEAPMLAAMVKEGKLPPVGERLPVEPAVVQPVEKIGQYGGTWRTAFTTYAPLLLATYEPLLRWDRNLEEVIPNIARDWKVSSDGTTYTFYLRKGMKWSDGEPFTADDVVFWYEDVLLNKELTPSIQPWFMAGGKPGHVEKIDAYTFKVIFSKPNATFLEAMASAYQGQPLVRYPKHYLKQFHPRYTSKDQLEKLVKQEKFDTWYQLFAQKADMYANPDLPVLTAWQLRTKPGATRLIAERNPYYWKVDPNGNQLPYLDRVTVDIVQDSQAVTFKALSGEIDMQYYGVATPDIPVLMEGREKGDYHVMLIRIIGDINWANLYLNLNVKDPVLNKLFHNKDFRIALSLAIDRNEINDALCFGKAEPRQPMPLKGTPYYLPEYEEYAKRYIEYDPKKANELLDKVGLAKRDAQGYRLGPDGKTLSLTIEVAPGYGVMGRDDAAVMVKDYFEKVGLKTAVQVRSPELYTVRAMSGEYQLGVDPRGGGFNPLIDCGQVVPTSQMTKWGPLYGTWYATGGKQGVEPPQEIKRLRELYEKALVTIDTNKRKQLVGEIWKLHGENMWVIGILGYPWQPCIIKNNFKNMKQFYVTNEALGFGHLNPEQFYIEK